MKIVLLTNNVINNVALDVIQTVDFDAYLNVATADTSTVYFKITPP